MTCKTIRGRLSEAGERGNNTGRCENINICTWDAADLSCAAFLSFYIYLLIPDFDLLASSTVTDFVNVLWNVKQYNLSNLSCFRRATADGGAVNPAGGWWKLSDSQVNLLRRPGGHGGDEEVVLKEWDFNSNGEVKPTCRSCAPDSGWHTVGDFWCTVTAEYLRCRRCHLLFFR